MNIAISTVCKNSTQFTPDNIII